MLLCVSPYTHMIVSLCQYACVLINRSKGRSRRQEIRQRWNLVRNKIPVTLDELNWKLDDDKGRIFFKMVCPYVFCMCPYAFMCVSICFLQCVLMLACVCPYDNMRMSL